MSGRLFRPEFPGIPQAKRDTPIFFRGLYLFSGTAPKSYSASCSLSTVRSSATAGAAEASATAKSVGGSATVSEAVVSATAGTARVSVTGGVDGAALSLTTLDEEGSTGTEVTTVGAVFSSATKSSLSLITSASIVCCGSGASSTMFPPFGMNSSAASAAAAKAKPHHAAAGTDLREGAAALSTFDQTSAEGDSSESDRRSRSLSVQSVFLFSVISVQIVFYLFCEQRPRSHILR